jgi:anti-sigma B factor antagonist
MDANANFFVVEQDGDTLIVTPTANMGELVQDPVNEAMKRLLSDLLHSTAKNLIFDFHRTDYFGSTALGFFVRLWRTISGRDGRMIFCNLSSHQREILKVTRLDQLWEIRAKRDDALQTVRTTTSGKP